MAAAAAPAAAATVAPPAQSVAVPAATGDGRDSGDGRLTVLVVGGGGRESALVHKLVASPRCAKCWVAPGNAGTATQFPASLVQNVDISAADVAALVAFARAQRVGLVVVGPEVPLAAGIVDELSRAGIACFGPTAAAARLETSKAFCKALLQRCRVPTAEYGAFTSYESAEAFIRARYAAGGEVVIKASGLAAGKGVVVAANEAQALEAAKSMLVSRAHGDAGAEIVVEDRLEGPEVSILALVDGKTIVPLSPAQDHKRIHEFDAGGNTGGMGAFAPSPLVSPELLHDIVTHLMQPVVDAMAAAGTPFRGCLFAGIMLTASGPRILEFNARFGDPETQVVLPLLQSDLLEHLLACAAGTLRAEDVRINRAASAVTIVAAADGYPNTTRRGDVITIPPYLWRVPVPTAAAGSAPGVVLFHAGTSLAAAGAGATAEAPAATAGSASGYPTIVTNGGRVLSLTATAPSLTAAVALAYRHLERISFTGMQYRRDIGLRYTRPAAWATPLRIAVLGSTRGTDLPPILRAIADGRLSGVAITVVVSNKADAGIVAKAREAGIEAVVIDGKGRSRLEWDAELCSLLAARAIDLVVLIGYMRILTTEVCARYKWRMINVHPSLLPEFAGGMDTNVHEAVLAAGRRVTGCTVHFVEDEVDGGATIIQRACPILPGDTAATLKDRVQALEGEALIDAIRLFTDDAPVDLLTAVRRRGWAAAAAAINTAAGQRLVGPLSEEDKAAVAAAAPVAGAGAANAAAPLTYAAAGVDIDAGDALVERIKPMAKSTARGGADADLGGFGGLFDLAAAGYRDPLLVSSTDGVGTKLKLAITAGVYHTVGIDLVAMSVNDLVVQGAEPLLFLDYYATGHLQVHEASQVVAGVAEGCRQAGCALVGGETAEMPSMYHGKDYDLAGFAVGAVERPQVLPLTSALAPGDVILGLESAGVHSNGFSLVRRVVERYKLDLFAPPPYASRHGRLVDDLLTPTRIYIRCFLPTLKRRPGGIKAMAHITGGGLPDNVPRVLRDDLAAEIDMAAFPIPPVFRYMQVLGSGIEPAEMARTFNCGIGMVVIVPAAAADEIAREIEASDAAAAAEDAAKPISRVLLGGETATAAAAAATAPTRPAAWATGGLKVHRIGLLRARVGSEAQVSLVHLREAFGLAA